jgi:DNA polymerase-3 subunit beta
MLSEGQRVLVAAKGLSEVQRLAGDGEIEVVLRERDVVFRTSRAEVTARLIEGEFPNYEQLIPAGYPNRLTVPREAFDDALERVQIVGQNRDNAAVRLAMSSSGLELQMSAQDVGNAQESLDAKFEGTELTVAFNPAFLREGVEAIDSAEVALETIDPLKPATLRAADGGDFLYLLMPVRTS